ncbi:MAG: fasciclin domain-containing protein [Bacteroidaceae bacterium]|nr:fasciclin domain-containing protein [Bacteroidaceae bacterium]
MNNHIKNTFRTGVLAAAGLVAMYSCSDTWDDHYNGTASSASVFDGTTMQAIEQQAPDFAAVLKAAGFDRELASSNTYTVWCPANGTFNKDSLIAVAQSDSAAVVKRFIQNHVARYNVSLGLEPQEVTLLNTKLLTMSDKQTHKIGNVNISETRNNIKCNNGILHFIDGQIPFQNNIFELIEQEYLRSTNPTKADSSLYAFLQVFNEDSLLENKSVSRGVDENGEKIWVDSVTLRNNTVLKNVDALVYDEDSSYIALIPSVEAFQKRYSEAKSLLKFNPHMDEGLEYKKTDSLQNYYANMFSMNDLFFNRNANEHWEDSLKSTIYSPMDWPYGLYYRKADNVHHGLPEDRGVNDILATVGVADSITCSNGIAYLIDEYPMSIYEQYFKKLKIRASSFTLDDASRSGNPQTGGLLTKNIGSVSSMSGTWTVAYWKEINPKLDVNGDTIGYDTIWAGDSHVQTYYYMDVPPSSNTVNPNIAFKISGNLSGKYDLYIVTTPLWFKPGNSLTTEPRAYRFNANIYEMGTDGNYPNKGTALLNPADNSKVFTTPTPTSIAAITDTTYLGAYEFKYAYYAQDEPGVILQLVTAISSSQTKSFSREMLITGFILKPHDDSALEESRAKRRDDDSIINTTKKY